MLSMECVFGSVGAALWGHNEDEQVLSERQR